MNIGLGAVLVAELGILILMWIAPEPVEHSEFLVPQPMAVLTPELPPEPVPDPPALASVVSTPLFQTAPQASSAPAEPQPITPQTEQARSLAARLSLIGVIAGEPPQAIIEDSQTKKSFFVTAGQSLIEGLMVKEILENRVVLDLYGERIELSL